MFQKMQHLRKSDFAIAAACLAILLPTIALSQDTATTAGKSPEQDFPASYVIHEGLIWTPTTQKLVMTWQEANDYCQNTVIHGMNGWRLPTVEELKELHKSKEAKNKGWLLNRTWASTPHHKSDHLTFGLKFGFSNWTNDNLKMLVTCVYEFKENGDAH